MPKFDRPESEDYLDWVESLPECNTCEGTGYTIDGWSNENDCSQCDGTGKIFPPDDGGE